MYTHITYIKIYCVCVCVCTHKLIYTYPSVCAKYLPLSQWGLEYTDCISY